MYFLVCDPVTGWSAWLCIYQNLTQGFGETGQLVVFNAETNQGLRIRLTEVYSLIHYMTWIRLRNVHILGEIFHVYDTPQSAPIRQKLRPRNPDCFALKKMKKWTRKCFSNQHRSLVLRKLLHDQLTSSWHNVCTFSHGQTMSHRHSRVWCYLEAIEGHEESQDVVGALEDPEDSQIPHHPLHSSVLQRQQEDELII